MAKCNTCGSTILFGGVTNEGLRYCNTKCKANDQLAAIAEQIPDQFLKDSVESVHGGSCPCCSGRGPIDIHSSHRVWSVLVLTSWSSRVQISCRSCAVKSKIGDLFFCFFLGWWGFPMGLIMTPIQMGRNFFGLFSGPDPSTPSADLTTMVRMNLAREAAYQASLSSGPPPVPYQS